jgi:GT2 family glycosyltransferase
VISVVVPNFNGQPHLRTLLRSIFRQNHADYEVMLVDDASVDASVDFVRDHFPETRIYVNPKNMGVSYSMNRGVAHSRGEIVTFLGVDQWIPPDYLQTLRNFMAEKEACAVCCRVAGFDGEVQFEVGWIDLWGRPRAYGKPHRDGDTVLWGASGAFMIRKQIFIEAGGFDTNLRLCEDVEFGLRLRRMGIPIYYTTRTYTLHRHSNVGIPDKDRPRMNRQARNYILRKHGLWCKIPFSAIWDVKSTAASIIRRRFLSRIQKKRLGDGLGFSAGLG